MKYALIALLAGLAGVAGAGEVPSFEIAVRGQPASVQIVVPRRASAAQRYAAEELAAYVEKLTGVKLGGASSSRRADGLGRIRLETVPEKGEFGASGFRLRVKDGELVITGSAERGCLYGVYELLERFGGVRWYASWCEKVPRLERFAVPGDLDVVEKPAFEMRQPFWHDVRENDAFAARLKVNGFNHGKGKVDAKFGGDGFRFGAGLPSCHTFETLLPTKAYFKDHPEYFSLVKGKRTPGPRSQLCLTNPDVFRIVLSNLLARIASDPGAKFYGVSQNDWLNYCECEKCKAVDDEEESHAGTMVRFVNALAAEVEKEFPDALVETLAYQYTRKPPKKTRLRKNVVPCLCTIECDFAHPLATGTYKENVSFREDIRGWAAQTDQLYVWDYVTNFRHYMGTFPNGRVLQDNLRFFRDNGVKMIFEQGDYQGPHADFAELKAWLIAKLAWNPDQPVEPLLRDFFTGYYGKAADAIRADYDATAAAYATKPDVKLSIYDDLDLAGLPEGYWNDAYARREAALKLAADDPEHAGNVSNWAFTVAYTRAYRHHKLNVEAVSPADMEKTLGCARAALKEIDANYDWRLNEFGGGNIAYGRRHRAQIAALVPDYAEGAVRWPTILPLADGNEETIARDARWLVSNTIVDSVAWCCTLVPEGGETPTDKASVYAARYRRMQPHLKGSGVRQGILFQATIGHGWTPGAPTGWQKIVSRDGGSLYKFCPLGAEFKRYIADQAKTLAALRPDFFMVDDDTRYLTGVDGCFCPVHLAGFAARQGRADRPWTREQLAAELAKDGRLAEDWDRYLEDTMVPLMETIRAAFPKDIPGQFCCCAGDSHHAARMAAALAAPGQEPVVRINNALYLNDSLRDAFLRRWGQTAWQINDLPEGTVVLDEADPCPQNRYSMDATRLVHHIAMNTLQGCCGAKIWLTRLGNVHEVESGRAYRELFREKHGWMREIARLRLTRTGVVIPQPNVRSRTGRTWCVFDWGTSVFGRMGIPYRYGNPVARHEVVALNADVVDTLEDGELEWYLEGASLLDGSAAEAVTKRGFAQMIGVKARRREGISVSAEKFADETLWNTVNVAADLADADAKAVPMSRYLNRRSGLSSETTDLGAGSLWFESAAGGKAATVASHLVDGQNLSRTDYYCETRKRELLRILRKLNGGRIPGGTAYAGDAEVVCVTGVAADGRRIVVLDNLGLDDVTNPELLADATPAALLRLADDGTWTPLAFAKTPGGYAPAVTLRTYRPEVLSVVASSGRPSLSEKPAVDADGNWVRACAVPRTAKAALLVPHSVGRILHPDWATLKSGSEVHRCEPGWGMTYRMIAVLNETGDSYAVIQKGARDFATFLRVVQGEKPGTVVLESGYVPDADDAKVPERKHPFETLVVPFRGGWFEATQVYKDVVRDEPWLKAARARDFGKMRDISFWFWNRLDSETVIPPVERFQKDAGVPVALDWYWWHKIPYDTSYPNYWPPREPLDRFAAAVKRLNAAGIFCQTYMNGLCWDVDDPSWAAGGEQGVRRRRDGTFPSTAWNRFNKHRLADMCGESPEFQRRIRALVKKMRALGFDGQYLDCIGNGGYGACWAANHRHAAGGGGHMVRDFRAYVGDVMRENPGMALCTEDVNESYLDLFTSFIVCAPSYERFEGGGPVPFEAVPAFFAVYHGAGVFFGNFATLGGVPAWDPQWPASERWTEEKDWPKLFPDQFPVEVARGVVWGLQPTTHNFRMENMTDPSCADGYRFMIDTARFYHAHRDWLFDGEMMDPGKLDCASAEVRFLNRGTYTKKGEYKVSTHVLPTVFHSVWRSPKGQVGAVLVNWSARPQECRLVTPDISFGGTLPPRSWQFVVRACIPSLTAR